MKTGQLAAGIAVGAVVALFLIPKTRKLITDAVSSLSGTLKDMAENVTQDAQESQARGTSATG